LAEDFFDYLLRSEESYKEKWHYLRENPVRAGLVKDWSGWLYAGDIFPLGISAPVAVVYDRRYSVLDPVTMYDQARSANLLAACEREG